MKKIIHFKQKKLKKLSPFINNTSAIKNLNFKHFIITLFYIIPVISIHSKHYNYDLEEQPILNCSNTNLCIIEEMNTVTYNYDFELDAIGSTPNNVTVANGTIITTSTHSSEGKSMQALTATSGSTAFVNMNMFPSTTDYSVTWKETYTTAGRSGFILRGHNANNTGKLQGYLFQVNPVLGHVRIYASNASNYTLLSSVNLTAPGVNTPRWYRATAEGNELTFEYSDNGVSFTQISRATNSTYAAAGTTQYTRGHGRPITGSFVDDVSFETNIQPANYDFELDTIGNTPNNIAAANGTIITSNHSTEGKSMQAQSATSGATAYINMDLFTPAADYSITWKETYTTAGRSGFMLRGHNAGATGTGRQLGYLFQANPVLGSVSIFSSNPSIFTLLSSSNLTAPGANTPRWYRASANGDQLTFEYSDNGTSFTEIIAITNSTYTDAGTTQYTRGHGRPITGSFVDDISFDPITLQPNTIIINNVNEYQVFQRNSSNQADLQISGIYNGDATAIEASFNGGTYTTIDANPTNGSFSGTLPTQNLGQGTLSVRFVNNTTIATTVNNVGVGDIFIIAGQSNASGRGVTLNNYSHPTLKASLFGNDDTWKELTDASDSHIGQIDSVSNDGTSATGSPWPIVATNLLASQAIPIAFVPTAKGATSILEWQPSANNLDPLTLYGSMSRRINAVGGNIAGVLFFQGERDAFIGTSQADYETRLTTLVNSIAADFSGAKTMIGQIGHSNLSGNDLIRAAHIAVINSNTNALLGPASYDINLSDEGGDTLHFKSDNDMNTFAFRWQAAITHEFYGENDGYGPILNKDNLVYDEATNTVIIPFNDQSSPVINAASSVSTASFSLQNNGATIALTGVSIVGNTIHITPSSIINTAQNITLSYASLNSAVDSAIYDSNNLPAQPFYNELVSVQSSPTLFKKSVTFDSTELNNELTLYPNPIINKLHLSKQATKISIYSLDGKKLLVAKKTDAIDLSQFESGSYYITIETDQGKITKLVMKE